MSTRIYVSTAEASYFETQLLGYDNNPPTEGQHTVGDIVLSAVQQNDVLGWVCVKAGNPGEWKVICDIVNVKNSINQNKNDISKLAGRVTKTEADIREINNDILDLNKNVEDNNSNLEDRINENANNISNLRIDVDVNKGNIKNNLNSINDLRTQIEDAKKTLNNVGNQANTNADDIANIERELLEIGNRLDNTDSNNTDLLNRIQNELNILKNNVGKEGTTNTPATGIHKELNDLQKEIDDLKDFVIDGEGDINSVIQNLQKTDENINKEINDIKELIDGNEADNDEIIEVLQKEIDDNKDDITELQKGVNDNKDDITELQKGVNDNKTEIDDLKQGLIDSLKEKNIDVKDNINWKELFDLLLQGLVKPEDPEEPENPDEPEDPEEPENPDEPIEIIDDEITIQVGEKYDATKLYTLQEGYNVQYKYSSIIAIESEHTIVGKEVGTTELEIICGGIIKTVTVNVVEPTGGMTLFDNGNHNGSDFGSMLYPSNYVSHVGDIDFNLTSQNCTYGAVCYNKLVNFNNYDAIAITVHTENTQQTGTQLMVGRGANTTMMLGSGTAPYTISYEESTFVTMTNTTAQQTYVFNCNKLRQEDVDTGYLGICVKRGNADGHVYIDKIVVYKDGEYYDNEATEPDEEPEDPIPCTYIMLNQSELTFDSIGIGQVLTAAVTPTNTTDTIVWTTTDNTVATVENGIVKSVGEGTCKITATCGSQKVNCYVTVDLPNDPEEEPDEPENIQCTYITLDTYSLYFDYIPYTQQLNAAVTPANTTDTIIWTTSNGNVATVENGIVKSVGEGTCKITATCGSQHISCNVTVEVGGGDTNKPCTGIHVSPNTVQLGKGESATVLVSLLPSDTTDNIDNLVVKNNISNVTHTVTRKSDTSMELKLTMSSTNIPTGGNIVLSINGINETCTIVANY